MKITWLHELIDYVHSNDPYEVRQYVQEQVANTKDTNKGYFWEKCLAKAMKDHVIWLGGNTKGCDYDDGSDAKMVTFYKKADGVLEASIGNIRNKIGPLRVCLVVPGENRHRVFFMFIPHDGYQQYIGGSNALKVTLDSKTGNISNTWIKYSCSFDGVTKPYSQEA